MNLAELRRLHEQATPAPWNVGYAPNGAHITGPRTWRTGLYDAKDAALIAAARNAFPALVDIAEAALAYEMHPKSADHWTPAEMLKERLALREALAALEQS